MAAVLVVLVVGAAVFGSTTKPNTVTAVYVNGTVAATTAAPSATSAAFGTTTSTATTTAPTTSAALATTSVPTTAAPTTAAPTSAAPTTKPTPKLKPKPAGPKIGEGTFEVGNDIKAGTYVTAGGDACYWERLKNLSGDLDGTLANDLPAGQAIVTVLPSDKAFSTHDCGDWHLAPTSGPEATSFPEGTFQVGIDIAPGTYKTPGGDECYWERESNFTGGLDGTLANDLPTGPAIVTIRPTDRGFSSHGCETWTKE